MYKTPRQCPRTPDDGLPHIGMERFIESTQFRGGKRLTVVMMFVGGGGLCRYSMEFPYFSCRTKPTRTQKIGVFLLMRAGINMSFLSVIQSK